MISGTQLRDALISGANHIQNHKQAVDELNVFPVPDGDTGTNMSMTMQAAARELGRLTDCKVSQAADTAASALLRGARGNSGVILSLLFRGFSKGLKDKAQASAADLAKALEIGVDAAYKAVMKPTEGTMLTVARLSSVHAAKLVSEGEKDPVKLWEEVCKAAEDTVEKTPEMLPVLKKAGVVDAGGMGLLRIFEGMLYTFSGKGIVKESQLKKAEEKKNAAAEFEGEITFTYCTEFIVIKKENSEDYFKLRAFLETIGDSVVAVDDDDIIKVHVHTDNPGTALQKGLEFGMLTSLKIENMREQHKDQKASASVAQEVPGYVPVDKSVEYGFVAVAAGEGVQELFRDLGVDNIVTGGQTMNPSTDDILKAIEATPAKNVIVLPNNKNIIMAAEQTIKLADRNVIVLPSRSIPQGLSAMISFNPDEDVKTNEMNMVKAIDHVGTGQITYAARDSEYDNHKIKEGELLGLENGKLAFTEKDLSKAVLRLLKNLVKKDSAFITLIYGEDVSEEQAQAIHKQVIDKFPGLDVVMVGGGQPVYYFILSVE